MTDTNQDQFKEPVPVTDWLYEHTGGGCHWHRREYDYKGVRFDVCVADTADEDDYLVLRVYTDSDKPVEVFKDYAYETTDRNHDCYEVVPEALMEQETVTLGCYDEGILSVDIPKTSIFKIDPRDYIVKAHCMLKQIAELNLIWEESFSGQIAADEIKSITDAFFTGIGRPELTDECYEEIQTRLFCEDYQETFMARKFIDLAIETWDVFVEGK